MPKKLPNLSKNLSNPRPFGGTHRFFFSFRFHFRPRRPWPRGSPPRAVACDSPGCGENMRSASALVRALEGVASFTVIRPNLRVVLDARGEDPPWWNPTERGGDDPQPEMKGGPWEKDKKLNFWRSKNTSSWYGEKWSRYVVFFCKGFPFGGLYIGEWWWGNVWWRFEELVSLWSGSWVTRLTNHPNVYWGDRTYKL